MFFFSFDWFAVNKIKQKYETILQNEFDVWIFLKVSCSNASPGANLLAIDNPEEEKWISIQLKLRGINKNSISKFCDEFLFCRHVKSVIKHAKSQNEFSKFNCLFSLAQGIDIIKLASQSMICSPLIFARVYNFFLPPPPLSISVLKFVFIRFHSNMDRCHWHYSRAELCPCVWWTKTIVHQMG